MKTPINLVGALLLILSSCCKIAPPSFSLEVTDSNGNSVLPEATSDSTWLMQSNYNEIYKPIEIISTGSGKALLIETDRINSGEDILIKVDENDLDTLNVEYKLTGLFCKKNLKIKSLFYNGIEFDSKNNRVIKH